MSDEVIQSGNLLNYLLVEGPDDAQVFFHLLRHYGLHRQINIEHKAGIHRLLDQLDIELERSGLGRLGIIVDADTDIGTRWQSLRDRLIRCGYSNMPVEPQPQGTIVKKGERPIVGIWLMPDNTIPGMLENFISSLVPPDDLLWPMANTIVQQVIVKDRRFPVTQTIKAHLHTWLAWQEEPGKPMGQAIAKHYFDANAPYAQRLINWLRQLFTTE